MMKKRAVFAAAIAIAVVAAAGAYSKVSRAATEAENQFGGHVAKRIAAALHLSGDQIQKMQTIGLDERPTVLPILGGMRAKHDQIDALTDDGNFDRTQIEPLAKEQSADIADLIVEAERAKAKAYAVLTPTQQAKVSKMADHVWARIDQRLNGGMTGHEWMIGFMKEKLDLTPDQEAQIKGIVASERATVQPIARQLAADAKSLRLATVGGEFDEDAVRAQVEKSRPAITEAVIEGAKVRAEVMAVLTPEQRDTAHDLQDQFRARTDTFLNPKKS
jgi:Spy/CpxP family protein refolding chaperone